MQDTPTSTVISSRVILIVMGLVASIALLAQAPQTNIRVEVTSKQGPVAGATVKLNQQTAQTDSNGMVAATMPPGVLKLEVSKEGFLPATVTQDMGSAREWAIRIELHPAKTVEEEITIY